MDFHVFLQISWLRECLSTWVTFVIFLTIMNHIYVYLRGSCLRKWLSTRVTFVVILTIMNWINVYLQVSCLRKWLATWVTFVIFLTIHNWLEPDFEKMECPWSFIITGMLFRSNCIILTPFWNKLSWNVSSSSVIRFSRFGSKKKNLKVLFWVMYPCFNDWFELKRWKINSKKLPWVKLGL